LFSGAFKICILGERATESLVPSVIRGNSPLRNRGGASAAHCAKLACFSPAHFFVASAGTALETSLLHGGGERVRSFRKETPGRRSRLRAQSDITISPIAEFKCGRQARLCARLCAAVQAGLRRSPAIQDANCRAPARLAPPRRAAPHSRCIQLSRRPM
jgi:hypothetical protein